MMASIRKPVYALITALALAAVASADPKDFSADVSPVFQGLSSGTGAVPMAVTIENKGPDARGQIIVGDETANVRYPIDLPHGAKKRVITYPSQSMYGGMPLQFTLDTNQGRMEIPFAPNASYIYGDSNVFALIGDTAGDLGFLRQPSRNETAAPGQPAAQAYFDVYCKPEDAPDRPIAFGTIAVVVLGPGSERLSDDSVKALKMYTLTGGTLLFVGGASAQLLDDRRWADVIPGANFKTKTTTAPGFFAQIGGSPLNESFTVSAGTPRNASRTWTRDGMMLASERPWGLGKIVFMAFNPFEDPFVRWQGRRKLFANLGRPMDFARSRAMIGQYMVSNTDMYYSGASVPATYSGPVTAYSPSNRIQDDPFDVELPSWSRVFYILIAYLIIVVPVNFIALRTLKRGELAWITAPVISLVFAGIFLNQASELYSARLSTATSGLMIVQEGMDASLFAGRTQMFFPNGGAYDLKLSNVDELAASDPYSYRYEGGPKTQIDPVDTGTILVPDLRASNLAFEEIGYRQIFEKSKFLQVERNGAKVRITNLSGANITSGEVYYKGGRVAFAGIPAGQSITAPLPSPGSANNQGDLVLANTVRNQTMAIMCFVENVKPNEVSSRSQVRLAYFCNPAQGAVQ